MTSILSIFFEAALPLLLIISQPPRKSANQTSNLPPTAQQTANMVSERAVKLVHLPLFALMTLIGLVTLAVSAALVKYFNDGGYPSGAYRDRIRICLVAAIWVLAFAVYFLVGVLLAASKVIFGIFAHLIALIIGFLLFIIGAASLTSLTRTMSCGDESFDHCKLVKALVGLAWAETIVVFIALLFVFALGVKSRSGAGMRRSTLIEA